MAKKSVKQKPSETAMFAALRRAIAHRNYKNEKFGPDVFAEYFLPPHFRFFLRFKRIRTNTNNRLNTFFPGLNEYMIARTAYFDKLFLDALNNRTPQIVLLGAGYDSRSYRFAESNRCTTIFELDIAPTQNRKLQCLKKARIDIPTQVKFVPIDFNQEALKDVLEEAGYKNNQKTLFIWEGVSYYLKAEAVDATLEFVRQGSHPKSAIAFDYTISISEQNAKEYFGAQEFSQTMKEHHASEALLFSIDKDNIERFFEQKRLKIVEHFDNKEIESTFLSDKNGSLIGPITGHFRFIMVSPGNGETQK